jgi:hypothetical protein
MSQQQNLSFTTPVGRIINGSVHNAYTTDHQGNPLIVKSGPNMGQPRTEYRFGLAVPKTQADFKLEPWAQLLKEAARQGYPHLFDAAGNPTNPNMAFAWKVTDGDSQIPNANGNKPCDMEGAPGNWVLWFSNGFAPKLYDWDNPTNQAVPLQPGDEIKTGYYAQVFATVGANGATGNQMGIYLNPSMVCRRAYGAEIVTGPSVSAAAFGEGTLPPGASTMPVAGATPPPVVQQQQTPPPVVQQQQTPPPVQQTPPPVQQTPPPVQPAHDLAQGPGNVAPPPVVNNDPILVYNGMEKPRSQWLAMPGWSEALVNAHCVPKA